MRLYFRTLSYARPFGKLLPQYILYSIGYVAFSIVNFAVMIPLLGVLFGTTEVSISSRPEFTLSITYLQEYFYFQFQQIISAHGRFGALLFLSGVVVGASILSNIFRYAGSLVLATFRIRLSRSVRSDFLDHLLQKELPFFIHTKKGDLLSRASADILEMEKVIESSFKALIKDPLMIISLFIVLFRIDIELTLYTLILLPISGFLISFLVRRLKRNANGIQETAAELNTVLEEALSGIRVLKSFAMEKYVRGKFLHKLDRHVKFDFSIAKTLNLAPATSEVLGSMTLAALLLGGGQMIFEENAAMSPEVFIGFLIIFSQVLAPAKSLSNGISTINRGLASSQRVFEILDHVQKQHEGAKKATALRDRIVFDKVGFSYTDQQVLQNINFILPKGKILAIVGASGSGKTTIADLLVGFYAPKTGSITYDGEDFSNFTLASLRSQFGVVSQEPILFHDTVYNNIAAGYPEATLAEVKQAAKVARADTFIEQLPQQYDTYIGERGAALSGGQQQRITIARALIKNPPILILDEATSSLDAQSESEVQQAIDELMKNRTTLIIAHRLSTVLKADEIVVLDQGAICQRGTHMELLNQEGIYKSLMDLQSI